MASPALYLPSQPPGPRARMQVGSVLRTLSAQLCFLGLGDSLRLPCAPIVCHQLARRRSSYFICSRAPSLPIVPSDGHGGAHHLSGPSHREAWLAAQSTIAGGLNDQRSHRERRAAQVPLGCCSECKGTDEPAQHQGGHGFSASSPFRGPDIRSTGSCSRSEIWFCEPASR